ncbi:hypothetical protein PC120_g5433 [Phytophthora cactorum]|nr:hypothetical protein PC120_g5433 [Phytophthora cactorum]
MHDWSGNREQIKGEPDQGFVASDDGLVMRTSVYVQNPKVFCECMKWKHKEEEQKWKVYYDMAPAVD